MNQNKYKEFKRGDELIKKLKILLFIILVSLIILTGCINKEIAEKDMEIARLKEEIESLTVQLEDVEKKLNSITVDDILYKEKMKVKDKFKWIKDKKWDRLVIAPLDSGAEYVIIDNKDILQRIDDFLYIKREVAMPPNTGFISDVPRYSYTFISGSEQYDVTVVARGIVDIDGHYYETNPYIHKLGDAFIKQEDWRFAGNIETKIANSGLIMTEFGPVYSDYRIQMIADTISESKQIKEAPITNKDEAVNYLAYYFGEEITIKAYADCLYINTGNDEYWYEIEDADYKIHHILNGMG